MAGSTRALVYAAGLGTRLAPLTDTLPKPLLPIGNRPLVTWTLDRLARAGCECVVLNLHHRGEAIRRALGDSYRGMPLVYSEEPQILGTFGALAAAREALRGAESILLVNGDSLCAWPFDRLLAVHRTRGTPATLLFADGARTEDHGGGVPIDRAAGRVLYFPRATPDPTPALRRAAERSAPSSVFAGAHVIQPRLLELAPRRFADTVLELYGPLLAAGEELAAVTTRRRWRDLGTPRDYLEGALGARPARRRGSRVAGGAIVAHSVIEAGAFVASGAHLDRCVILPGARVGEAARLRGVLVGFGAVVPAGGDYADCLLARPGGTRPAGSVERAGLLEIPLDPGGQR